MTPSYASLVSTGSYLPEIEVPNSEIFDRAGPEHREFLERIERSTGIRTRFVAPQHMSTSDLAVPAAEQALARANLTAADLDLVVVGTDTPDYITPATSVVLQHKLGATRAGTFDIGCACASFPTALATVAGLLASSPGIERALVVGAYRMSKLCDPRDPVSFFYGDGAGAAVLVRSSTPGFVASAFRADGSFAKRWCIASGGTAEPASVESVEAGRTKVRMLEAYPSIVNDEGWPALATEVVARADISLDDVRLFVFTQVRRVTIEKVMAALGQPIEKAPMIMERSGYTGSACIPMALDRAARDGRLAPGDRVVLVGSGVGFNQAAALVRIDENFRVASYGAPARADASAKPLSIDRAFARAG
jgi:3-oxoacyl-[acyl-carrier-protein] synthase-3